MRRIGATFTLIVAVLLSAPAVAEYKTTTLGADGLDPNDWARALIMDLGIEAKVYQKQGSIGLNACTVARYLIRAEGPYPNLEDTDANVGRLCQQLKSVNGIESGTDFVPYETFKAGLKLPGYRTEASEQSTTTGNAASASSNPSQAAGMTLFPTVDEVPDYTTWREHVADLLESTGISGAFTQVDGREAMYRHAVADYAYWMAKIGVSSFREGIAERGRYFNELMGAAQQSWKHTGALRNALAEHGVPERIPLETLKAGTTLPWPGQESVTAQRSGSSGGSGGPPQTSGPTSAPALPTPPSDKPLEAFNRQLALDARETAQTARDMASEAGTQSTEAADRSQDALSAADEARQSAATAVNTARTAAETADEARSVAEEAADNAVAANQTAAEAQSAAERAASDAAAAKKTAEDADSTASDAASAAADVATTLNTRTWYGVAGLGMLALFVLAFFTVVALKLRRMNNANREGSLAHGVALAQQEAAFANDPNAEGSAAQRAEAAATIAGHVSDQLQPVTDRLQEIERTAADAQRTAQGAQQTATDAHREVQTVKAHVCLFEWVSARPSMQILRQQEAGKTFSVTLHLLKSDRTVAMPCEVGEPLPSGNGRHLYIGYKRDVDDRWVYWQTKTERGAFFRCISKLVDAGSLDAAACEAYHRQQQERHSSQSSAA